jgi:cytochrome c-type biogenesis protein CcmE
LAILLVAMGAMMVLAVWLIERSLVFYRTPSQLRHDIAEGQLRPGEWFRLGGQVTSFVVNPEDSTQITLVVSDGSTHWTVHFHGLLPPMFRVGQGVVAEGSLNPAATHMQAEQLLTKHDEYYRPPQQAPSKSHF